MLRDGRTLHTYDALADGADVRLAVFWHHGTPNLGAPAEPLLPGAAERGIRWVSYDRPGYGGSTPTLAAVCGSGLAPYHALGLDWFAGMGPPARRSCALPPGGARRWRTTWRRPSTTRNYFRLPITPPWRARGARIVGEPLTTLAGGGQGDYVWEASGGRRSGPPRGYWVEIHFPKVKGGAAWRMSPAT